MSVTGVTTFLPQQVDETSVIQFVALVQDDDLETMIRAEKENWMAAVKWRLLLLSPFRTSDVQSRLDALQQIGKATYAELTAADWRVFNRYCAGK
jgi:hypothetical protein